MDREQIKQVMEEELYRLDLLDRQNTNTSSINHYQYELDGSVKKKRRGPRLDEYGRRVFDKEGHYILPEHRPSVRVIRIKQEVEKYLGRDKTPRKPRKPRKPRVRSRRRGRNEQEQ